MVEVEVHAIVGQVHVVVVVVALVEDHTSQGHHEVGVVDVAAVEVLHDACACVEGFVELACCFPWIASDRGW